MGPTVPPMASTVAVRAAAVDRAAVSRWTRDNGVYVALGLLLAYNAFFTPRFDTWGNLSVQLIQDTRIIAVALGMALVIGTEGIDLSVGAVMALAGGLLVQFSGLPGVVAILLVLAVGALVGLLNGTLVAIVGVQPIVATLAFLFAGRSLAQLLLQGQNPSIHDPTVLGISEFGKKARPIHWINPSPKRSQSSSCLPKRRIKKTRPNRR